MPPNTPTHPMSVISNTSHAVRTGPTSFHLVPMSTILAVQVYIFGSVSPPGQHIILPHGTHHIKLAKKSIEYKGKCKLDHDTLIIRGIRYKFNTLHLLPEELAPYKSAQISTETTTVFHGLHSPLSNFHNSSFTIDGQHYHTAEQFIQHKKALHFNDYKTAQQILATNDPFEAKTLSRNIERYDKDAWKAVVKEICYPGIRAKFEQNILLKRFLKSTSPTQLGESSYDKLWGTGLPLHDKNATNTSYWSNIGLLGEILMDLHDNNLTKE